MEDKLARVQRLTGRGARPAWGPRASPAVAPGTHRTHPLLLTVADGHRGGGRGTVPELGRLSGSQQAPGEPAGPLAGHRGPFHWRLGPGASVSRRSPGRASLLYAPAVQEAELGGFPPSSPLNSQEAGFSRAHPHSAHPLRSSSSSGTTLQTLRLSGRAANSAWLGRICSGSRGTRVGGGSTRAAHSAPMPGFLCRLRAGPAYRPTLKSDVHGGLGIWRVLRVR